MEYIIVPTLYYKENASGSGDGSNWANSKAIESLKLDLAAQGATTTEPFAYFIGSPKYAPTHYFMPETNTIPITVGGTAEFPVQVHAGDMSATVSAASGDEGFKFYGNRELPWQPGNDNGNRALSIIEADYVDITGMRTVGLGGWFPSYEIRGARSNVTIRNHHGISGGLILRINEGNSCTGLEMADISIIGATYGGLYLQDNTIFDSTFSDINILAESTDGRGYSTGVFIGEGNDNLTFNDVFITNTLDSMTTGGTPDQRGYVQGDGFVIEDSATNITINRGYVQYGGDGGYDIKSNSTHLNECVAIGYKYCYRIWGVGSTFENIVGWWPESKGLNSGACFEAAGGTATLNNPSLKVDSRATARHLQEGATAKSGCIGKLFSGADGEEAHITINRGELETNGLPAFIGSTGSSITLSNVAVDGVLKTTSHTFTSEDEHWSP